MRAERCVLSGAHRVVRMVERCSMHTERCAELCAWCNVELCALFLKSIEQQLIGHIFVLIGAFLSFQNKFQWDKKLLPNEAKKEMKQKS